MSRLVSPLRTGLRPLAPFFASQGTAVLPAVARVPLLRRYTDSAAPEPSEPAPQSTPARYPWRFSFEPPYPPQPDSFFGRVLAPIKSRHFANLGLQRAKRHLPPEIAGSFPDGLLKNAPAMVEELFHIVASVDAPEDLYRIVATPVLANRLIQAASEAEQLGLDVQFTFPAEPPSGLQVTGYRFIYGPRDANGGVPEGYTKTTWFDGLITLIVPEEKAAFKRHQQQRDVVLAAMAEGGVICVDVKVNWKVGMKVLEDSGKGDVVVEDQKDGLTVTFESSRFIGGPKGHASKLVEDEEWGWKIADLDLILSQELSEI